MYLATPLYGRFRLRASPWSRAHAPACVVAGLLLTALLGAIPGQPRIVGMVMLADSLASPGLAGLSYAAAAGLMAWLLAASWSRPVATPASGMIGGALVAMLILPNPGVAALIVPQIAAIAARHGRAGTQTIPNMVQCSALLIAASAGGAPVMLGWAGGLIFGVATIFVVNRGFSAANDNPSMERAGHDSRLSRPLWYHYNNVSHESGQAGVAHVQQQ